MASKNIKGITIEINGDVTKLDKALSQVDKDLNATQKNLKEVDRLLKLDPKNVELLDQKQRLLAKAVEQTKKRYETLKESLAGTTVDDDKAEEWAKKQVVYQQQITKTQNALEALKKQMMEIEGQSQSGLTEESSAELKKLSDAALETEKKLQELKDEAAKAYEEMGKPISQDNYDAIQRELAQTSFDMKEAMIAAEEFELSLDEMSDGVKDAANDTKELENGVDSVSESMDEADDTSAALNEVLKKLGISMQDLTMAGVVGLAVEAIKALVEWTGKAIQSGAEYADNILTLSTEFGISTEKLQEYSYMAELVDTDMNTITGSIAKLTKSMDAARNGNEDVAQAFAKLNIRVTDSTGKLRDADEVFEQAIGGLSMIADGTERDTIAWKLFGKSVQELNPLISAFTNGTIKELREESHRLYVLSSEDLETLGAVDDGFRRLDKAMEMAKNRIAIQLAPSIIELTDRMLDLIESADWDSFGRSIAIVVETVGPRLLKLGEIIVDVANALSDLFQLYDRLFVKNTRNFSNSTIFSRGFGNFSNALPAYASGGVVAPNNPMLAIVGDNRTEREVISPESLIRQIVREEAAGLGGGRVEVVVRNPSTTDNQIVRELTPEIDVRTAQRGRVL